MVGFCYLTSDDCVEWAMVEGGDGLMAICPPTLGGGANSSPVPTPQHLSQAPQLLQWPGLGLRTNGQGTSGFTTSPSMPEFSALPYGYLYSSQLVRISIGPAWAQSEEVFRQSQGPDPPALR